MSAWPAGEIRSSILEEIGEGYRRYRLAVAEAEEAMARSPRRYGQIAPIVVRLRQERAEAIDGFKRLAAARTVPGFRRTSARQVDADERGAKAAIYGLNCVGRLTLYQLAATAIQHFCVENGTYNNNQVALSAVTRFLAEVAQVDSTITGFRDLRSILTTAPTVSNLTKWAKANYPLIRLSDNCVAITRRVRSRIGRSKRDSGGAVDSAGPTFSDLAVPEMVISATFWDTSRSSTWVD